MITDLIIIASRNIKAWVADEYGTKTEPAGPAKPFGDEGLYENIEFD